MMIGSGEEFTKEDEAELDVIARMIIGQVPESTPVTYLRKMADMMDRIAKDLRRTADEKEARHGR